MDNTNGQRAAGEPNLNKASPGRRRGSLREKIYDALYFMGSCLLDFGMVTQIWKLIRTRSADDFALEYPVLLVVGSLLICPRAFRSTFWVWKVANVLLVVMSVAMLALVWMYQ